jgi:hypothetical protein
MTTGRVSAGWYTFLHDFTDGGIERVADELAGSSATHVNVATLYHVARDVLVRNPRRRVRYLEGGALYFRPDATEYGRIVPTMDVELAGSEPLHAVRDALNSRGLEFNAWMVFLHDNPAPWVDADLAQRNAFGDAMLTDLCPANPDVIDYCVAVARDTAKQGPRRILAESLHYHSLQHGFHHERYLVPLGALAEFALSLCFCRWCTRRATESGVDLEKVRLWARSVCELAFRGEPIESGVLDRSSAAVLVSGEMEAFLRMREDVVSELVGRVQVAAQEHGAQLVMLDPSGAVKGWATGVPTGPPVIESGWQFGLDIARLSRIVDEIEVLGYTYDPQRLALDLAAYRAVIGPESRLRVSMRPVAPDTGSAEHLAEKLLASREQGSAATDFYHYGLVPPTSVDRVQAALGDPRLAG